MDSLTFGVEIIQPDVYLALGLSGSCKGVNEFPRVLSLLSLKLERVVEKNGSLLDSIEMKECVTMFHGSRAPNLSIQLYIERIFKYSKCSPSCFVLAYIYIDRFLQQPDIHLTPFNVHRLLITSVAVAAKFIDDAFFNNAYYARVGGISTAEMNRLELNFLFSLDFRLSVSNGTFGRYCSQLDEEASRYHVERPIQVCSRKGWGRNIEDQECQPALQSCSCGAV